MGRRPWRSYVEPKRDHWYVTDADGGIVAVLRKGERGRDTAALLVRAPGLLEAAHDSVRLILAADAGERKWEEVQAEVRVLLCLAMAGDEAGLAKIRAFIAERDKGHAGDD